MSATTFTPANALRNLMLSARPLIQPVVAHTGMATRVTPRVATASLPSPESRLRHGPRRRCHTLRCCLIIAIAVVAVTESPVDAQATHRQKAAVCRAAGVRRVRAVVFFEFVAGQVRQTDLASPDKIVVLKLVVIAYRQVELLRLDTVDAEDEVLVPDGLICLHLHACDRGLAA